MTKMAAPDYLFRPARKLIPARLIIMFIIAGFFILTQTACTTTTPAPIRNQTPIAQGPDTPRDAEPSVGAPKTPSDETPTKEASDNRGGEDQPGPEVNDNAKDPKVASNTANQRPGLTPPHMRGRDMKRLGLLLPFSASSPRLREEAASMLKAAQLAVFSREKADVLLIALDTGGTSKGADSATRAAIKSGVDVILGPVLSRSVTSASKQAQRKDVPVIAFSTDQSVAGNGTYLLSFPPEAEVRRVVEYAASTGAQNFAFLGPQNTYGKRVLAEYKASVSAIGGQITALESYNGKDIAAMQTPARNIAKAYTEHEKNNDREARRLYEAIMLPEGNIELRSLAPLLPYYDIDPDQIQFMGTSRWHRDDVVREPALSRGIFAGPDQTAQRSFKASYDNQYAQDPSRLASLAYDAVNIGAVIADGDPRHRQLRAEDPVGFYGADGLISWNYSGRPNRGLAIYQIRNGRFEIIDPAPTRTSGPS